MGDLSFVYVFVMYANDAKRALDGCISDREFALFAGLSVQTVQRKCRKGDIPGAKQNGRIWRIPATAVEGDLYSLHHRATGHTFRGRPLDAMLLIKRSARMSEEIANAIEGGELDLEPEMAGNLASLTEEFGRSVLALHRALTAAHSKTETTSGGD